MPINESKRQWRAIMRFDHQEMVCCTQTLAERYLAQFPDHGFAWLCYASSLCQVARYPEALSALRRAARLCPPNKLHLVQNHYGHLYQQRGSFRRAESWFRRSIATCPADASAHIYLGSLLALEGRFSEAEAIHRQATQCERGCIDEAFFNLGLVLRAQERYLDATAAFRSALDIDPRYKAAQKELSDVERVLELNRNG